MAGHGPGVLVDFAIKIALHYLTAVGDVRVERR